MIKYRGRPIQARGLNQQFSIVDFDMTANSHVAIELGDWEKELLWSGFSYKVGWCSACRQVRLYGYGLDLEPGHCPVMVANTPSPTEPTQFRMGPKWAAAPKKLCGKKIKTWPEMDALLILMGEDAEDTTKLRAIHDMVQDRQALEYFQSSGNSKVVK